MDYEFRYQLHREPEARNDGSGGVTHDIQAVYREEGTSDDFQLMPHHQDVVLAGQDLIDVLLTGTDNQKVTAYKNLIRDALGVSGVVTPPIAWDQASLESFMDANDVATDAQSQADIFITVDLGQSYPIRFVL